MMNSEKYELDGINEALEAMDALAPKELLNVIRSIERKALNKAIVQPLRSAIPNVSLKKGVGITQEKSDKTAYRAGIKISPRKNSDLPPEGVILLWIEAGTKPRQTKKGYNRGQINPRNLLKPIIAGNASDVITYFNEIFIEEADKIVSKKLKKIKK